MTYKFNCEICKYSTNRLYCYNKHLNTKKHIDNRLKKYPNSGTTYPDSGTTCSYCKKQIIYKNHLKRHYDICKEKIKRAIGTVVMNK